MGRSHLHTVDEKMELVPRLAVLSLWTLSQGHSGILSGHWQVQRLSWMSIH